MNILLKRILFFLLGLLGFISLLCSIAASSATNENLMRQGFLQFSQTAHLNVPASRYGDYAHAVAQYLDGKTADIQIKNPDTGEMESAFSDKENRHLRDVRGIITKLKIIRWAGALVLGALFFLYVKNKARRAQFLAGAVRGFALAALSLLAIAAALAIWGAVNFDGLFWTFHQVCFTNELWLLNPNTDVLMALMPLSFFTWYAGEMLKALLPVLVMMLLVLVAWARIGKTQKEANAK